ncbi:hypothetical protein BH11ARM1_BH11ARM1_14820 [soil metagenome]
MFAMKRLHLFAVLILGLAALIGCAGSGGSDNTNTTGTILDGTPRIEAVVVVDRTNLKDPSKYTDAQLQDPLQVDPNDLVNPTIYGVQDPRNIQTGEQYYFQLAYYDSSGSRRIINDGVTWTTSDSSGIYGNIGSNSGLFLAGSAVNQTNQFVFGLFEGTRYEVKYNVNPRQVRLLGKVLDEHGAPVPGVQLNLFNSFNSLVGQVVSSFDGSFRASVPTNTQKVTPTVDSIPANFYQSFSYGGLRYTVGLTQCKAQLPTLETGTVVLSSNIVLKARVAGQSTPSPTGCTL